jgi:beta-glucosidase
VQVTVQNTGKVAGEEVIQLYVSSGKSGTNIPVCSLKGFKRIMLKSGENKKIVFELNSLDFGYTNAKGEKVVSEGEYFISVGGGQPLAKSLKDKSVIKSAIKIEN